MATQTPSFYRDILNQIVKENHHHLDNLLHLATTIVRENENEEIYEVDVIIYFDSELVEEGWHGNREEEGYPPTWKHTIVSIEFDPPTDDPEDIENYGGPLTHHEIKHLKHWFQRHEDDADSIANEMNN